MIISINAIKLINYAIPNYSSVNSVPPIFLICNSISSFAFF